MKIIILLTAMALPITVLAQNGTWTKETDNTDAILTVSSGESVDIKKYHKLSKKEITGPIKTELAQQKAIATHQNIEIEEILATNEMQRAQIALLRAELNALKGEIESLKKELID